MSLPCLDGVGTLSTDVRRGLTKAGKRWAGATVRFASRKKDADDKWVDDTVIFVSVVGFDLAAEELAAFSKGDMVTVIGKIKALGIWNPERGEPRPSLEMYCEHVAPPPERLSKGAQNVRTADLSGDANEKPAPRSADREATAGNVVPFNSTDRLLRAHRDNPRLARGRNDQPA
jgi:single-stranded DNA-binding protein